MADQAQIDKDIAAITERTHDKMNAAIAQDIDWIMSNYWNSPDFVLFDPCPGIYVGWQTLKDIFLDYHGKWPAMTAKIDSLRVGVEGDLGYAFSIQEWRFTKPDGEDDVLVHRLTEIWKRIDGEWKCIHEHASVPQDLLGEDRTASNEDDPDAARVLS